MSVSRRKFLYMGALSMVAVPLASKLSSLIGGDALAADADLPLAKDTEEPAKSLKFCANADKPSKNCSDRKGADKKGQYCYNCQLFTKASGEKKTAKGKCMIMPKNSVGGGSWCQSWVKNPAVEG